MFLSYIVNDNVLINDAHHRINGKINAFEVHPALTNLQNLTSIFASEVVYLGKIWVKFFHY